MLYHNTFFIKNKKILLIKSVLFGLITGLINLIIIYLITHIDKITLHKSGIVFMVYFLLCALLYVLSNYISLDASSKLSNSIIIDLRLTIQGYILETDYKQIENLGNDALYAINNDDISKIEKYAEILPRGMINIFNIIIILMYTAFIDWPETLLFVCLSLLSFLCFFKMQNFLKKQSVLSRKLMDKLTVNTNSLLGGIRELRVSYKLRRKFFIEDSKPIINSYHIQQIKKNNLEQLTISWFWLSFYVILAACCYMLKDQHITNKMIYIMPLLMIFGPMTMLMSIISVYFSAKVALDKINSLHITKSDYVETILPTLESVEISNLSYRYFNEDSTESFHIGPISFSFNPGKVIFIIGGNGSGKSTTIKLLTHLYKADAGTITVNGKSINTESEIINYQSYLGVIYQTPHIFSTVLTVDLDAKKEQLVYYLNLFELSHKVIIENHKIMNLEKLSYGQKKRLGLIIALLEDKAIYVFDEWAADQDPHFRRIFYLTIVPKLKSAAKVVIIVTHDDEYFKEADEIIKLREGIMVD